MTKFHITDSGPKVCTAEIQCPLGKDSNDNIHYSSKKEAFKAYEEKMSSKLFSKKPEDNFIKLESNMGSAKVLNGDLNDVNARILLASGLCGDLALNIHEKTGAQIFFVSYMDISEEQIVKDFERESNTVFRYPHVLVGSIQDKDGYIDSYGYRTLEDIEDFYETSYLIPVPKELCEHFAGKDYKKLEKFAETALEFDKKQISFPYEDIEDIDY